jgi:hypothetical protein
MGIKWHFRASTEIPQNRYSKPVSIIIQSSSTHASQGIIVIQAKIST